MGERRILILTGEPSGDRAAGPVAAELRRADPDLRLLAVGGPELRAAGCEIIQDISELGAMGFLEIVRQIPRLRRLEAKLRRIIDEVRPAAVVPVDYPGFNLRIARYAKSRDVPVVYYIGPQVWAWGAGRVPKIGRVVDRMLVVFPFEVDVYRAAGVAVDFVGHPLLDRLEGSPGREAARRDLQVPQDGPVLGLLPGSRVQEVRRIFPVMVEASKLLRRRHPDLAVVASVVDSVPVEEYRNVVGEDRELVRLRNGPAAVPCAASDVLLVTSGTATLEAALRGAPLAVLYRTSTITWFLGKRLVRIPRIALANIVAGEELVREFLQGDARAGAVAEHVDGLLRDADRRVEFSARLRALRDRLGSPGVAKRVANIVLEEARA